MDTSGLKNKNILIVEDDPVNCELLKEILESTGAKLIFTTTGKDAVDAVRKKNMDMVLMDIQLPGIDGYEATRQIKKIAPDVPIIAQTAYAFESDRIKSLDAGCVDYIAKPFNKEALVDMMLSNI